MLDKLNLEGKTIVVTGGGSGLGKAMSLALAEAGADVVVAARRQNLIDETASEIQNIGRKSLAIATDVTDSKQIENLFSIVRKEFGKIDVLINNAGIVRGQTPKPIWEITDEEWREGMDVNLSSTFYCSSAVAQEMTERGSGKIINVASGLGFRGANNNYMYGAAKGGVVNLTRVLTNSLSRHGVNVSCIVPGFISTDVDRDHRSPYIPIGRTGYPVEIGPLAVYLASDASNYVSGNFFTLDGGGLAGGIAPTGFSLESEISL